MRPAGALPFGLAFGAVVSVLALAASCGDDGSTAGGPTSGSPDGAAGGEGGASAGDAAALDGGGTANAEDAGPCPGKTLCNGECVQTHTDLKHCGACGVACSAAPPSIAECVVGVCVATLATSVAGGTTDLAVDASYVYWTSAGVGTISRMPIGGGPPEVIATGLTQPHSIIARDGKIYWAVNGANAIMKANADGSSPVKVTQFSPGEIFDLAVNDSLAYYTTGYSYVMSVPLAGAASATQVGKGGTNLAQHLAIDGANVYFTEYGNSVYRAPLDGGATTQFAVSQGIPQSGLALTSTEAFWGTNSMTMKAPLGGGTAVKHADTPLYGIVTDGTSLYGFTPGGSIVKIRQGASRVETLSYRNTVGAYAITDIAVDGTSVYWTETVSNVGKVMKATPK